MGAAAAGAGMEREEEEKTGAAAPEDAAGEWRNAGRCAGRRGAQQQWEDGERRKKMMTCGARESVIGERAFIAIYVFIYTCSWPQVVSICILCHFCEKQKIVMVCFEIDE